MSEPHTCDFNAAFSLYIHICYIIGASLSEPHTNGTSAVRVCYIYVCMYVVLSIVRRAIIQCRLLFCVHNSTFQHAMRARAARDQLGGAGRPSQPLTFRIHNVSTLSLFNVKWMPRAPLPRARGRYSACYLLQAWMLQAWMLQDAPNHRGTERRGYGVGGNAEGPAAQPRRPNNGHIGYGSDENETARCALQSSKRRERAAVYARYQS